MALTEHMHLLASTPATGTGPLAARVRAAERTGTGGFAAGLVRRRCGG
jgi:hypothetical protein